MNNYLSVGNNHNAIFINHCKAGLPLIAFVALHDSQSPGGHGPQGILGGLVNDHIELRLQIVHDIKALK